MGRKIPSKKHRGVKDPLQQQARRLQSLKTKINAPPSDPDEQPAPRSLQRLFAHTHAHTHARTPGHTHKHIAHAPKVKSKKAAGPSPVSSLQRVPGESGRDFSLRINCAVRALHCDVTQQHYPEDLDEVDSKGSRMRDLRERRARKLRRVAARGDVRPAAPGLHRPAAPGGDPPALTRGQKLTLKKKAKREKAAERLSETVEVRYERVEFGAAAAAPPALSAPRRAAHVTHKAGARDLLLTSLLTSPRAQPAPPARPAPQAPAASERARLDAVAAYRALKARQRTDHNKK